MFFEAMEIDDLLKCGQCNHEFDEPRNLPCGNTVCTGCLNKITKTINERDNSFKCSVCQGIHNQVEFPINILVQKILQKSPAEVYRSSIVEKANLKYIETKTKELKYDLLNGADKVKGYCIELRINVDLATEIGHRDINAHRDTILGQINAYEAETIGSIQMGTKAREGFQTEINELNGFTQSSRSYLTKMTIEEKVVRTKILLFCLLIFILILFLENKGD
jgi:hypothetical protein